MKTQWKNRCIAIWTALFVLHAPLCAFACLSGSTAAETTPMAAAAAHEIMPCHQQEAPRTTSTATTSGRAAEAKPAPLSIPEAPENSSSDCGCEGDESAVLAHADQDAQPLQRLAGIPPQTLREEIHADLGWPRLVPPKETDLPPPDILLLNATFLI